jgi:hypothetical protein
MIFADSESGFCGALQKYITHNHPKGSFESQLANVIGQDDNLAKLVSTVVAFQQMLLDYLLLGTRHDSDPVIGKHRRINGPLTFQGAASNRSAHIVASMHFLSS